MHSYGIRQSLNVCVVMPSFRPGSYIHECHRLSHGLRSGWLLSRLLALTFDPRCVSASIVPQQTCVSFEFLGLATYFGTSPSSGHSAQQSGCSAGSWIITILRLGILNLLSGIYSFVTFRPSMALSVMNSVDHIPLYTIMSCWKNQNLKLTPLCS